MKTNRLRRLPLLMLLLTACCLLMACWGPPPAPGETPNSSLVYLESIGDAAVRLYAGPALRKYAPEAMPIVDVGVELVDEVGNRSRVGAGDGVVTLAEVKAIVAAARDPAQLTWLILMAGGIWEARRSG